LLAKRSTGKDARTAFTGTGLARVGGAPPPVPSLRALQCSAPHSDRPPHLLEWAVVPEDYMGAGYRMHLNLISATLDFEF
jgi:hypothetical protein